MPFAGTYVRFDCGNYQWELNGTEIITCTSHGNYSAAPPKCKKRPEREGSGSSSSKFLSVFFHYHFFVCMQRLQLKTGFNLVTLTTLTIFKAGFHSGK